MSAQRACIQCGAPVENEAVTGTICLACSNKASGLDDALAPKVGTPAKAGLALAVVPFVVSYRQTSSSEVKVNGRVVESTKSGLDYVALPVGVIGAVLGLVAIVGALKAPPAVRKFQIGAAVGALLLGLLHVARGVM